MTTRLQRGLRARALTRAPSEPRRRRGGALYSRTESCQHDCARGRSIFKFIGDFCPFRGRGRRRFALARPAPHQRPGMRSPLASSIGPSTEERRSPPQVAHRARAFLQARFHRRCSRRRLRCPRRARAARVFAPSKGELQERALRAPSGPTAFAEARLQRRATPLGRAPSPRLASSSLPDHPERLERGRKGTRNERP